MSRLQRQINAMLNRVLRDFSRQPLLALPFNALQSLTGGRRGGFQQQRQGESFGSRRHFADSQQQEGEQQQQQSATSTGQSAGERNAEEYHRKRGGGGGQLTARRRGGGGGVPSLFDDRRGGLFDSLMFDWIPPLWTPVEESQFPANISIDIVEDTDKYTVKAALPGIEKNDVKVKIEKDRDETNYLVIHAEKKDEKHEEDKRRRYIYMESSYGEVNRRVPLPTDADPEKGIDAKMENGELRLEVKKNPDKRKESQEIQIN